MANESKSDGYLTKWRHFHPQSTVWVKNPLGHDVVFNVADEHNNPYQYRMPQGKTSELPGGAVATLGVKAIVDELIQSSPTDSLAMWEIGVRSKYEAEIIVRYKEAPTRVKNQETGEINLGTVSNNDEEEVEIVEEEEAPNYPTKADPVEAETRTLNPRSEYSAPQPTVPDFGAASLVGKDTVVIEE